MRRSLLSLDNLIAWLKNKEPKERYDYMSCTNCLLAQYFTEAEGYEDVKISTGAFAHGFAPIDWIELPSEFHAVAFGPRRAWTFGAALKRARKIALQKDAANG